MKYIDGGKSTDETRMSYKDDDDDVVEDRFHDSFAIHPEEEDEKRHQQFYSPIKKECKSSSIFPPFIHAGLQRKAPFTEFKYWIALSLTLDGRDKITKALQYTSRLLAWWFLTRVRSRGHGRRFISLHKSLGKSRKAFRLGRSINEIQKIASVGWLGLFFWNLKQQLSEDSCKTKREEAKDEEGTSEKNKEYVTPSTCNDCAPIYSSTIKSRILQNFDEMTLHLAAVLSSSLLAVFPSSDESKARWWKVMGSSLKAIGMFGYWLGDNANYLTSSGVLDNYSLSEKDRLARRKRWQDVTGKKANQFYFFATIIGLVNNSYAYYRLQLKNSLPKDREEKVDKSGDNCFDMSQMKERKRLEEIQFTLFLALVKSFMDLIVVSNDSGIDLHQKWRGRKNHEAIHCLCGLISAGTSLYSNFPDAKT